MSRGLVIQVKPIEHFASPASFNVFAIREHADRLKEPSNTLCFGMSYRVRIESTFENY